MKNNVIADYDTLTLTESLETLEALKLMGMKTNLQEQTQNIAYSDLNFEDRIGIMVKAELDWQLRDEYETLLRKSGLDLRDNPSIYTLKYEPGRGLKKSVVDFLAAGKWIDSPKAPSLLVTGPTGCGKTYLISALAMEFMKIGKSVRYLKHSTMLQEIDRAIDHQRLLAYEKRISRYDVVIIDDYAMAPMNDEQSSAMMDLLDFRIGYKATIVASQLEVAKWHEYVGNALRADAIMDRLTNFSHLIALKGESLRKGALKSM